MALSRREAGEAAHEAVFAEHGLAIMCEDEGAALKALDLTFRAAKQANLIIFRGAGWLNRFRVWHMRLSTAEQLLCRAAPLDESGKADPWQSQDLGDVICRLETPWFWQALRPNALVAHLQPIMDLRTKYIFGHEALARSNALGEPVGGGQLVQAAKAHRAMNDLEKNAAQAAARAMERMEPESKLFINMLPSTLACPTRLIDHLLSPFAEAGGSLERTVVELVESEAMDPTLVRQGIERIRRSGAMAALDDVGSGHAAPGLIEQIRPDVVKLDRSLLKMKGRGPELLRALVDCSHDVGAVVVVEGIEDEADLDAAMSSGADLGQGWHIGRPAIQPARMPSFVAAKL